MINYTISVVLSCIFGYKTVMIKWQDNHFSLMLKVLSGIIVTTVNWTVNIVCGLTKLNYFIRSSILWSQFLDCSPISCKLFKPNRCKDERHTVYIKRSQCNQYNSCKSSKYFSIWSDVRQKIDERVTVWTRGWLQR